MNGGARRRATESGRVLPRAGNVLLTLAALLGAVSLVGVVVCVALDVRPLVFRSGSMAPEITTGSVAFARSVPAEEVRAGDVVSVVASSGVRITHRVETVTHEGGTATMVLKGDANERPDAETYTATSVQRVVLDLPYGGYAMAWLSGPLGTLAGGALVAVLVWLALRPAPTGARRRDGAVGAAVLLVLGGGVAVHHDQEDTLASFNDTAAVTGGTVSTYKLPKPVITCSRTGNLGTGFVIRMTWPVSSAGTVTTSYAARIVQNARVLTVQGSGGTRYVEVTSGLLGSVTGSTATVEVTASRASTNPWTSEPGRHDFTTGLLGLSFNCSGLSY